MKPRRFFTVERANRALPLVSRIVEDVVRKIAEHEALGRRRAALAGLRAEEVERQQSRLEDDIERHVGELASVGCELKDPRRGLIDFWARRGDEMILLCWLKGEERVDWWHAPEAGFAGRRSVSELPAATRGSA